MVCVAPGEGIIALIAICGANGPWMWRVNAAGRAPARRINDCVYDTDHNTLCDDICIYEVAF